MSDPLARAVERDNLPTEPEAVALVQERMGAVREFDHDTLTCPACRQGYTDWLASRKYVD